MAPKSQSYRLVFVLVLAWILAILPQKANAAEIAYNPVRAQSGLKLHEIKFYLDPALVPDLEQAKAILPIYVQDMNTILAKNTNRQLVFDPEVDIHLTSTDPQSNWSSGPLPEEGFEIWAVVQKSTRAYSLGGWASLDKNGAGVLAGMYWTKVYDPENLSSYELTDYWIEVNNMLHEFAHIFGAGCGEYYNLTIIHDTTGTFPLLDLSIYEPNDSFWQDKPDFLTDPLLWPGTSVDGIDKSSRQALLKYVQFSELTATILNNNYRNSAPQVDLQHILVKVSGDEGQLMDGADVKVWSVEGMSSNESKLLTDITTDANGLASFVWGGASDPHNNIDFLRLIKVYKDGYLAAAKYISIFDADIARLVKGEGTLVVEMSLASPPLLSEGDTVKVEMSQDSSPVPFQLTLDVTNVNADGISWSISAQAVHGKASVSAREPAAAISYRPNLNYSGPDSFVVEVTRENGGSDSITVNVDIQRTETIPFMIFLPLVIH